MSEVKGYKRKTKSGKVVTVKGYSRSGGKMEKRGSGREFTKKSDIFAQRDSEVSSILKEKNPYGRKDPKYGKWEEKRMSRVEKVEKAYPRTHTKSMKAKKTSQCGSKT